MAKKILNKVKESMQTRQNERKTKKVLDDAYKVRDIIMSVKNRSQFFVAEKTVENFIKKWNLTEDSPEVTFLNRHLNIKKKNLRLNKMNESGEDPGRLKSLIKKILIEEIEDDLQWIKDIEPFVKTKDLQVGREYVAYNIGKRRLNNSGEDINAEGKTFVVTKKNTEPILLVDILWIDLDDEIQREDFLTSLSKGDWKAIYSSEPFEGDDETIEEEGSHWDNDPNWGTDKSYWNNDPKWGSSGGGSSNGNTDSGF